jgi:hypothetical protein
VFVVSVRRCLAFVALVLLAAGVRESVAQTVIVINAPADTGLEFVLDTTPVASGKADAEGIATLAADRSRLGDRELDARVFVDTCSTERRVVIVGRGVEPPASGGCTRAEIPGLFLVQRITTVVVDVAKVPPSVRIRQGDAPEEWVRPAVAARRGPRPALRDGLVLFGGGGLGTFRDFVQLSCGNVTDCGGDEDPTVLTAGLAYWFSPFIAVEASFIKPGKLIASGRGDGFQFDSNREGGVVGVAIEGGIPIGSSAKLFGKMGVNYQRSTFTTHETIEERTITTTAVPQTLAGGSQTFQARTGGWAWLFGAGAEYWFTSTVGAYGEVGGLAMKGSDLGDGEAAINDTLRFAVVGLRVRVPLPW